MKRELMVLFLLGILLFFPLASAQEQFQAYSGFNKIVDNIKLFFSAGDNKVRLALEIREKEVGSALKNIQNNDEESAFKDLERARKKLLIAQEKVSVNVADDVKANVKGVMDKIKKYENLSEEFETYLLEEEKTQLIAELVIEVEGKQGQTLKREIVKDGATGQNRVRIVIDLEGGKQEIIEVENKIVQLENKIAERIISGVEIKTSQGNETGGLTPEVKMDIYGNEVKMNKVEHEIKTDSPETLRNDLIPTPDLNKINPDLYDPSKEEVITHNIDGGVGEENIDP